MKIAMLNNGHLLGVMFRVARFVSRYCLPSAVCRLLGDDIDAEVQTNKGRIDCVLQTHSHIYVSATKTDFLNLNFRFS
ncbi:MAG: hypothetical protein COA42_14230 [Alteromonadaceae bacterium]|nr:MAG: hypothetical protein COA42_14230 [Alteromonadaceae bacterium]